MMMMSYKFKNKKNNFKLYKIKYITNYSMIRREKKMKIIN